MNLGNKCQCTACGRIFRTLKGFDRHRVGVIRDRRCLSMSEMLNAGFYERDGIMFTGGGKKDSRDRLKLLYGVAV